MHPQISKETITRVGKLKQVIMYEFFKKPMASKLNNGYRGALPEGFKITTGVQEVLRRLRNTGRYLPPKNAGKIIRDYMQELREGGFPKKVRLEIVNSATVGFGRLWEKEIKGETKINQPSEAREMKRR